MVSFKDFDEEKLLDYSDEELKGFINEIEMKRSILNEQCAEDMSYYLKQDSFDVFSNSGERKINKIAKKYAELLSGADMYEEQIRTELQKREDYQEQQRYSGNSLAKKKEISKEEFLQKEQDKTWAYKSKIE